MSYQHSIKKNGEIIFLTEFLPISGEYMKMWKIELITGYMPHFFFLLDGSN